MVSVQKKNFISDCDCIVDFDELEKAILWYQKKPTRSLNDEYFKIAKERIEEVTEK